ncbi:hypothetical protein OAO18_03260 [Francisellaceae bacterium]|nr:hypothetical protein [Francisellaceae bacterium]
MKIRKNIMIISATIASLISATSAIADISKRGNSMVSTGQFIQSNFSQSTLGGAINMFSLTPLNMTTENECYIITNPSQAITFKKNTTTVDTGKVTVSVFSDASSYASSLGVSASLSAGYGMFTASASFSSNASTAQSSTGIVASWLSSATSTATLDVNNLALTDVGKQKLAALEAAFVDYNVETGITPTMSTTVIDFISSCGAAIAYSIETGHSARMDVNILTSTASAKSTIAGSIEAGAGSLASLTASMTSASENKTSSFGIQASAYAQPGEALKVNPSSLSGCNWDSTTNSWNDSCKLAQNEFDSTNTAIQSDKTAGVPVSFPDVIMTNQLTFLSNNASIGLADEIGRMKAEYIKLSNAWLEIKNQLTILNQYLAKSSFPSDSIIGKELSQEKIDEFNTNFIHFSSILDRITALGYIDQDSLASANLAKEAAQFPPLTASLLSNFVDNPSNETITNATKYYMKNMSGLPNHSMTVLVDHEKYSEIVLGGKLIYNGNEDGKSTYYYCSAYSSPNCVFSKEAVDYLYNVSFKDEFCTSDSKAAELYGYAMTTDKQVFPLVVHSLRSSTDTNSCSAVVDQNFNTIPASSYDNLADTTNNLLQYTSVTPLANYYWAWLSDGMYTYDDTTSLRTRGFLTLGNANRGYYPGLPAEKSNYVPLPTAQ